MSDYRKFPFSFFGSWREIKLAHESEVTRYQTTSCSSRRMYLFLQSCEEKRRSKSSKLETFRVYSEQAIADKIKQDCSGREAEFYS